MVRQLLDFIHPMGLLTRTMFLLFFVIPTKNKCNILLSYFKVKALLYSMTHVTYYELTINHFIYNGTFLF